MIPVREALEKLFTLTKVMPVEEVPLVEAAGRVLAKTQNARRTQPPFAASAMDGYAVPRAEVAIGARFTVIGEAAAGNGFEGTVGPGQAIRIFTGAPLPQDDLFVVIQEDVTRDGAGDTNAPAGLNARPQPVQITITLDPGAKDNIRPSGGDFCEGDPLAAPRRLSPSDIALLASMNIPRVPVFRQPGIALISTGDELVMPGDTPGPDQIIASNTFGLKAMLERAGANCRILPIAHDTVDSLKAAFALAQGADLVVTIGGASVGDHDLVAPVSAELGMERSFYKIAMRPGKPLMAGNMGNALMVGLPGNPVSAMVCGELFLRPVIDAMLGLPAQERPRLQAPLTHDVAENGPREHYMRAKLINGELQILDNQDSSLLSVLSAADALVIRPIGDPARARGEVLAYLPI